MSNSPEDPLSPAALKILNDLDLLRANDIRWRDGKAAAAAAAASDHASRGRR
jgi:hypothetical protein